MAEILIQLKDDDDKLMVEWAWDKPVPRDREQHTLAQKVGLALLAALAQTQQQERKLG